MEFFQRTISQDLFYERYTKMKEGYLRFSMELKEFFD